MISLKRELRERIQAVLHMFHLEGKRQDIGLGRLLLDINRDSPHGSRITLHEPTNIVLDEPTIGIDPLAQRAFWRQISALAEPGLPLVILHILWMKQNLAIG